MRKLLASLLLVLVSFSAIATTDIIFSKNIKPNQREILSRDLTFLENYVFRTNPDIKTLKILGIDQLNSETLVSWLNDRIKYIIEEDAFKTSNILLKKSLFVERENVTYPNVKSRTDTQNSTNAKSNSRVTMTNVSAEYYIKGKKESKLYGVKITPSNSNKSISVRIDSPRAGIIRIGTGLFASDLAINRLDPHAYANSIKRLSVLFHEARHSDGNGDSLGFTHSVCPPGHDYQGELACDTSANGAYATGASIARELMLACNDQCTDRDLDMLKIFIMDNYNRIQTKVLNTQNNLYLDTTPEEI